MTYQPGLGAFTVDLDRPARCARDGVPFRTGEDWVCTRCQGNDTPGCDLVEQDGWLFGWSESNCWYERLGLAHDTATLPSATDRARERKEIEA